jgi:photosystem II stability/assembly factor-like uncharacterized protein
MIKAGRILLLAGLLAAIASPRLHAQIWTKVNDTIGYTVTSFIQNDGALFAGTYGGVYRSTDGGIEWSKPVYPDPGPSVNAMVVHNGFLFAATSDFRILRSTDNGLAWFTADTGMGKTDSRLVLAVGVAGDALYASTLMDGIFRSTDNGETWVPATNGIRDPTTFAFIDHDGYIFAGTDYGLFRTGNNGELWTRVKGLSQEPTPMMIGFAVIKDLLFIATTNGLYRWDDEHDTVVSAGLQGKYVVDVVVSGLTMYAAIYDSGVFVSWDAGVTWQPMNDGLTDLKLTSLTLLGQKLYAGVENGGIWEFPAEFIGDGVEENPLPNPIALHIQPNPATERAIMLYTLTTPSSVSIAIYDALGRVVLQPVDKAIQGSGEHRVVLETEGLAAGVYYCTVNTGNTHQTTSFVINR